MAEDSVVHLPPAIDVPKNSPEDLLCSTTSSDTDVKFDRFNELPGELKLEIFRHHLRFPWSVTSRSHDFIYGPRFLNTALANKELCSIAFQIYYHENTFKLAWLVVRGSRRTPLSFRYPSKAIAHLVTKLEIHMEIQDFSYPSGLFYCGGCQGSQLAVLSHPRRASFTAGYTCFILEPHSWANDGEAKAGWGRYFTSLQELRIVIHLPYCLPEESNVFFERLPEQARLLLQAKNIQVEVEHAHERTRCDGHCERTIERGIIGMTRPPIPNHYTA